MIPNQTFIEFPEFCNTGTKTKPDSAKYAAGFVESDVLPAEWLNYFENRSSVGITDLNRGMSSVQAEMNNVLDAAGKTPAESDSSQLVNSIKYLIAQAKAEAILAAHPVGSLYWTESTENPNTTFGGGTWVQIKDKFILAAGDTYTNKATGGNATVTLTVANLPSHSHTYTPSGSVSVASHTHGLNNHTHSFTPAGSVTVSSHSHGLNNHTHTFTPAGTVSSTFSGSAVTSSGMSDNSTGKWGVRVSNSKDTGAGIDRYTPSTSGNVTVDMNSYIRVLHQRPDDNFTASREHYYSIDVSHTHTVTPKGTVSSTFTGTAGTTGGNTGNTANTTPIASFSGSASSTGAASGNTAGTAPSATFTGSQSSTLLTGNSTSFSIMPPYEVKYCWKRTA